MNVHTPLELCDETEESEEERKLSPDACSALIQKCFLKERKVFLWGEIDDRSAKDVTEKILYMELKDKSQPIQFFINTPGGSITAGMAIYDTMQLVQSPIQVIVTGLAASMGSILLSGAPKGQRLLYPNARVLIHQPLISGRFHAQAIDIHIQAQEMEKTRNELNHILANASGQPLEKIQKDTDRDFYMNAKEAIAYGLADAVIEKLWS
ncbi:MAG: ATP-dependent Clp protease proteolytic subunit [Puniceicoccales bacterium]|jgi:ATP-dependent Clp protease protease subunit|nr:ATP-dependent Clp protease proteolytic subunit [Puniceicoccales bacterium]